MGISCLSDSGINIARKRSSSRAFSPPPPSDEREICPLGKIWEEHGKKTKLNSKPGVRKTEKTQETAKNDQPNVPSLSPNLEVGIRSEYPQIGKKRKDTKTKLPQ